MDDAIALFGSTLEAELHNVQGKTEAEINKKRERLMMKWLDMPLKFRSPAGIASGRKSDVVEQVTVKGEVV